MRPISRYPPPTPDQDHNERERDREDRQTGRTTERQNDRTTDRTNDRQTDGNGTTSDERDRDTVTLEFESVVTWCSYDIDADTDTATDTDRSGQRATGKPNNLSDGVRMLSHFSTRRITHTGMTAKSGGSVTLSAPTAIRA